MIRRGRERGTWTMMLLLLAGASGCASVTESLPLPEATAPSFEIPIALDLASSGQLGKNGSPGEGTPAADRPQTEKVSEETASQENSAAGISTEPASQLLAQVKPSQAEGPGDVLRDPEPAKDANYDPFEKPGTSLEVEEYDPLEPFNQVMFKFNRKVDEYVLRPVAKVYDKVVPDAVQQGISNMFLNIRFVPRLINNALQGKFKEAGIEGSRFLLNSTLGLAGFSDFAKEVLELEIPLEDTGQTLGVYGVKPGPYLVLPFLGSFTFRDGFGFIGDLALDPFNWLLFPIVVVDGWPQVVTNEDTILFAQLGIRAGYMVNERALNIDTTFEGVEAATVDLYGAVRNAYLQRRARAIRE